MISPYSSLLRGSVANAFFEADGIRLSVFPPLSAYKKFRGLFMRTLPSTPEYSAAPDPGDARSWLILDTPVTLTTSPFSLCVPVGFSPLRVLMGLNLFAFLSDASA